ncbi:helix-turn-helix domain-containing protein [Catellatospora paridis]|uniref:helix-turn-helix domain-containing protein n=1 Tax=Catellatospora paridis TaxID=1617086 RepID=UPI0012D4A743|nr:helix-turn-helix transcriptional regulator [Catellatospora paridis]
MGDVSAAAGDRTQPDTEWGRYLRRMTRRPGWSVAKLARDSGIARQTIFDWIRDGGESVTVGSVRRVAEALGDDVVNALTAAANVAHREADEEITPILQSDLDPQAKADLVEYLTGLREAQRHARRTEITAMLNRPRRAAA